MAPDAPADVPTEVDQIIEADNFTSDGESAYGSSVGSDTTSVTSSVYDFVYENGRRYASRRITDSDTLLPNDETEQERMDMTHHLWNLVLKGELALAPVKEDAVTLDLGTGTGIWAIDFADMYPDSSVTGTDLSPIQPAWTPPNCKFEVDDFDREWVFSHKFDYIHGRSLMGAVKDWKALAEKAFAATTPGGYFELQETCVTDWSSDDNTFPGSELENYRDNLAAALKIMGLVVPDGQEIAEILSDAGFEDVTYKRIRVPMGTWAKDRKMKEIGTWVREVSVMGFEAYGLFAFTKVLGWDVEKAKKVIQGAMDEAKGNKIHTIIQNFVVYGRKPETTAEPAAAK